MTFAYIHMKDLTNTDIKQLEIINTYHLRAYKCMLSMLYHLSRKLTVPGWHRTSHSTPNGIRCWAPV